MKVRELFCALFNVYLGNLEWMEPEKISVFIVDDEDSARSNLMYLLKNHCKQALISGSAESIQEAMVLIERIRPDILFLDIQLQDGTGFDLLDQLKDIHFNVVFTSAYDEFAVKAFRYNAIDYLLKPIHADDLIFAFQKASQWIDREEVKKQIDHLIKSASGNKFDRLALPTSDGLVFTEVHEIIRLESFGNYSFVFLAGGQRIITSHNLKLFEEILPSEFFFRIHQSFIINTNHLKKVGKEPGDFVEMTDEAKVPVARRRKVEFLSKIKALQ